MDIDKEMYTKVTSMKSNPLNSEEDLEAKVLEFFKEYIKETKKGNDILGRFGFGFVHSETNKRVKFNLIVYQGSDYSFEMMKHFFADMRDLPENIDELSYEEQQAFMQTKINKTINEMVNKDKPSTH